MSSSFQWYLFWIGVTNSVQPYCRLAIITMQMTPKISCHHRPASRRARAAWTDAAASPVVLDELDFSFLLDGAASSCMLMGVLLGEVEVLTSDRYVYFSSCVFRETRLGRNTTFRGDLEVCGSGRLLFAQLPLRLWGRYA